MAIRLCLTLCILILIAKPSGTRIQASLDGRLNRVRRSPVVEKAQDDKSDEVWEPEMPAIWLVRDPKAFGLKGETSEHDRSLNLRLTYQEWLAIYLDGLGLDKDGYERWAAKKVVLGQHSIATILTELDEEIPGFPMLSRISGPYHDVIFELDELEDPHKECLKVQAKYIQRAGIARAREVNTCLR
jgi:hypothetical protein